MNEKKSITFPVLNGLKPNVESCTMKVLEEVGELMQLIGKGRCLSGEKKTGMAWTDKKVWAYKSVCEALDVAQAAITMTYTLCYEYGIDVNVMLDIHENKLKDRGYLVVEDESVEQILATELKCRMCQFSFMHEEDLVKLGSDPCDTCNDLRNWKPKEPPQ